MWWDIQSSPPELKRAAQFADGLGNNIHQFRSVGKSLFRMPSHRRLLNFAHDSLVLSLSRTESAASGDGHVRGARAISSPGFACR